MDEKHSAYDNKNQLKKCVSDLYIACEERNHPQIMRLVNDQLYSYYTVDIALRKLLYIFDSSNSSYLESVIRLLKVFRINTQNQYDKSTILMEVCSKGDIVLLKTILESTCEDDKLISENIDFTITNVLNRNVMHYICDKNLNEDDSIEMLDYFFEFYKNNHEVIKLFQAQLESVDKEGNAPISQLLEKGRYRMVKKLYSGVIQFKQLIVYGNNNLLHCAVIGKSVGCLKIVLINSKSDDFKQKNKEGLTPAQLAYKKGYQYLDKIIGNYESNHMNLKYQKCFFLNNINSNNNSTEDTTSNEECNDNYGNDGISSFLKEDYEETQYLLNQYKLDQTIDNDLNNLSIDWNILLVKYKSRAKIKKSNKKNDKDKNDHYDALISFLNTSLNETTIKNYPEDSIVPIDILIYNKGFLHFINTDVLNAIKVFSYYLTYILKQNDTQYYKWIMYLNISFILIEIFYSLNQITICHIIIEKVDEFLITNFHMKNDANYSLDIINKIYNFLNESEIFNQFTPKWDEAFSYLLLLKIMTNYTNKTMRFGTDFKHKLRECSYINELKVFQRMKLIYISLKIKKYYMHNYTKCLKKLNAFKQQELSGEYQFFYYNSLGILNLKLKNYASSEFLLKNGINCFKAMFIGENNKYVDYRTKNDYLCKMKFNLALALFFQRKFNKAREILIKLTHMRIFQKNIFIWYRLGLCALELEMGIRSETAGVNEIYKDLQGYDIPEEPKNNEEEATSIDLNINENNSNNSIDFSDELYRQFEKECINNTSRKPSDANDDLSNNPIINSHKRFILHSANLKRKNTNQFLIEAIKSFKQVLLLSKYNIGDNKDIDDIFAFYSKDSNTKTNLKTNLFNEKGTPQSILISSYYNLLFGLTLKEEWMEILCIIKQFYHNTNLKSSMTNDMKLKIEHYQIEALINLQKEKEALIVIKKHLETYQSDNYRFDYYSKKTHSCYSEISFKLNFHISLAIIHIRSHQLNEAEKCLQIIMKTFIKDKNNLPPYLISLLIYYHMNKGKATMPFILDLLKRRKMQRNIMH